MALSPEVLALLLSAPSMAFLLAAGALLLRGSRDLVTRALAAGLGAVALPQFVVNSGPVMDGDPTPVVAIALAGLAAIAFLVALVPFPRPLAPAERGPAMGALGFATMALATALVLQGSRTPLVLQATIGGAAMNSLLILGLLLLPLRYLGEGGPSASQEQRATAAVGGGLAFLAATWFALPFGDALRLGSAEAAITSGFGVVALAAAMVLWWRCTVDATLEEARRAWVVVAMVAAALVLGLAPSLLLSSPEVETGARAATGVAAAGLLAWAFLGPWREARRQG